MRVAAKRFALLLCTTGVLLSPRRAPAELQPAAEHERVEQKAALPPRSADPRKLMGHRVAVPVHTGATAQERAVLLALRQALATVKDVQVLHADAYVRAQARAGRDLTPTAWNTGGAHAFVEVRQHARGVWIRLYALPRAIRPDFEREYVAAKGRPEAWAHAFVDDLRALWREHDPKLAASTASRFAAQQTRTAQLQAFLLRGLRAPKGISPQVLRRLRCRLEVFLDASGTLMGYRLRQPSTDPRFDRAVMRHIEQLRRRQVQAPTAVAAPVGKKAASVQSWRVVVEGRDFVPVRP
ncbi:MAG: TonB C-terminal domain-containing protein [Polyangiales bacterium]